MVNLDKWEEIEHEDVEQGDRLKIVEAGANYTTIYKAEVLYLVGTDFYLSDGSIWEDVEDGKEAVVTLYRRKPKAYEFPKGFGAIIAVTHKTTGKRFENVFNGRNWIPKGNPDCLNNEEWFRRNYKDFETISEGI